jgi:hypothetical protein
MKNHIVGGSSAGQARSGVMRLGLSEIDPFTVTSLPREKIEDRGLAFVWTSSSEPLAWKSDYITATIGTTYVVGVVE